MNPNRLRTFLYAAVAASISILFCFALFEYGISYFFYPETQEKSDKQFDAVLGWRYKPGAYSVKPDNSFVAHTIHINELGLRETNPPTKPSPRQARVVVLGDSFTFGRAVPQQDLFTSRLQDHLNKRFRVDSEVINAGVEGYGTAQQLLWMQRLASHGLIGNVYVLQLFTNDILDNLRLEYSSLELQPLQPGYIIGDDGKLDLRHKPQEDSWRPARNDAGKSFRTYKVLKAAAESYAQSRPSLIQLASSLGIPIVLPRTPGLINAWYTQEVLASGLPLFKALLREIKLEAEKQSARLLVVSIPSPLMVYPDTYGPILKRTNPNDSRVDEFLRDVSRPQRAMQKMCEELQVPFFDVYPALIKNNANPLYIPREGHFTKEGHEVVAEALAERLAAIVKLSGI